MELIDKWKLIQHQTEAKNFSPEMLVIGTGYVMDAEVITDKIAMANEELIEEHKLAYEIFDELFSKKDKTELEKKILHFAGMIMQTHGFFLDK